MRFSKEDTERRRDAVRKFFRANPTASADTANKALKEGKLTGKPEVTLNIPAVYALREEARKALRAAAKPPAIPKAAKPAQKPAKKAPAPAKPIPVMQVRQQVGQKLPADIRKHILGLRKALAASKDIETITVDSSGGVKLWRIERREVIL